MKLKTCFECKASKPPSGFYVHKQMADGRLGKCKTCCIRYAAQRPKEIVRAIDRKRQKTPKRRAKRLEYQRKSKAIHPEKHKARRLALELRKTIKDLKCSVCSSKNKIEAHHPDYSEPTNVVWLCFVCHRKTHGQYMTG